MVSLHACCKNIWFFQSLQSYFDIALLCAATQRAEIAEKVHKPPLGVDVINFELNGFNAFIWVP